MAKISKRIEIVASSKHELNSMSPRSREAIRDILSKKYTHVDVSIVNNLQDLEFLAERSPDMVFLGMKFIPNDPGLGLSDPNKVWISEYLDRRSICYTGSGHTAVELELNKDLAKRRIAEAGLRTSKFQVIGREENITSSQVTLSYPLFVKPTNRGGGSGVDTGSLVHNFRQLCSKVQSLAVELRSDALVEEYLPGREFSVGILKDEYTNYYSVMPLELVAPMDESGERFLSGHVKSMDAERHSEILDIDLKAKINALALGAFKALGARDYGRIDIRLDATGTPHFLEANLLPSLLFNYGNFPRACLLNIKLMHEPMILKIINLAFSRGAAVSADILNAGPTFNKLPALISPGPIF
jgi:D-alanine-D-alanine ligase